MGLYLSINYDIDNVHNIDKILTSKNIAYKNIVHYYREKHNTGRQHIIKLLYEKKYFKIPWSQIIKNDIEWINNGVHSIFQVFNIEKIPSKIELYDNYLFYPHLDHLDFNVREKNINLSNSTEFTYLTDPMFNTNDIGYDTCGFYNLYKRFNHPSCGLYVQKPSGKIVNVKKIHQIWLGPHEIPADLLKMWVNMNKNWEFYLWTDDENTKNKIKNIENGLINYKILSNNMLSEILRQNLNLYENETDFHIKAKILSYHLIYKYGGIYIDIDCYPIIPLNDNLLIPEAFFAFENEYLFGTEIAHYVFGATAKNPIISQIIDLIDKNQGIILSQFNKIISKILNIFIYPSYYFYPSHYFGFVINNELKKLSYCSHLWMTQNKTIRLNYPYIVDKLNNSCSDKNFEINAFRLLATVQSIHIKNAIENDMIIPIKKFYKKIIDTNCKRYDVLFYMGKLYRQTQKYDKAYEYLKKCTNVINQYKLHSIETAENDKILNNIPSRIKEFDIYDEIIVTCFYLYTQNKDNKDNKNNKDEIFQKYKNEALNAFNEMIFRCTSSINNYLLLEHYDRIYKNITLLCGINPQLQYNTISLS